jgi:hypothetical protein
MQTAEQQFGSPRHGIKPLTRRLSLRFRCASAALARGTHPGKDQKPKGRTFSFAVD